MLRSIRDSLQAKKKKKKEASRIQESVGDRDEFGAKPERVSARKKKVRRESDSEHEEAVEEVETMKKTPRKRRKEDWDSETEVPEVGLDVGKPKKRKRKTQKRKRNPFSVEKSKYNLEIFETAQPFVQVTNIPIDEKLKTTADKVSDGKSVHPKILECAWEEIFDSVWATRASVAANTELGGRPIHAAYLSAFKFFMRRRTTYPKQPAADEFPDFAPDLASKEDNPRYQTDDTDDTDDLYVKAGGKVMTAVDIPTSDESFSMTHEGDEPKVTSTMVGVKTNYDFKVKVSDKHLDGQLVTVLVVECQWDNLDLNKTFQAAAYAIKGALNNMLVGRYKPIYLQSWGERTWRHAILVPYGIVTVRDNAIVKAHGPAAEEKNLQMLKERFQRKITVLRDEYNMDAYPDGDYVVAHLWVVHQKYDMPFLTCDPCSGMATFIQSLLRILIGNRILSMSPEEFIDIINARKEERTKERMAKGRSYVFA